MNTQQGAKPVKKPFPTATAHTKKAGKKYRAKEKSLDGPIANFNRAFCFRVEW
jgi:hypothetical protein